MNQCPTVSFSTDCYPIIQWNLPSFNIPSAQSSSKDKPLHIFSKEKFKWMERRPSNNIFQWHPCEGPRSLRPYNPEDCSDSESSYSWWNSMLFAAKDTVSSILGDHTTKQFDIVSLSNNSAPRWHGLSEKKIECVKTGYSLFIADRQAIILLSFLFNVWMGNDS